MEYKTWRSPKGQSVLVYMGSPEEAGREVPGVKLQRVLNLKNERKILLVVQNFNIALKIAV